MIFADNEDVFPITLAFHLIKWTLPTRCVSSSMLLTQKSYLIFLSLFISLYRCSAYCKFSIFVLSYFLLDEECFFSPSNNTSQSIFHWTLGWHVSSLSSSYPPPPFTCNALASQTGNDVENLTSVVNVKFKRRTLREFGYRFVNLCRFTFRMAHLHSLI